RISSGLHAHVNLIPLNPTPGWPTQPSPKERIRRFAAVLQSNGVNVTVRDTRGRAIDAACGQLRWTAEQGGLEVAPTTDGGRTPAPVRVPGGPTTRCCVTPRGPRGRRSWQASPPFAISVDGITSR